MSTVHLPIAVVFKCLPFMPFICRDPNIKAAGRCGSTSEHPGVGARNLPCSTSEICWQIVLQLDPQESQAVQRKLKSQLA